jgi:hypothetical protein
MKLAGPEASMGEVRNAYNILVGKPGGKRPIGRHSRRWKDIIRMDYKEMEWEGVDWWHLPHDRD